MQHQKFSPRAEYRQQESERVKLSAAIAEKFPSLKTLIVDLASFDEEGHRKSGEIRYTVNLAKAKSAFRFDCPNDECVRGDFDLTTELAKAVAARCTTTSGEVLCQGWRSKTTIGSVSCRHILRFTFSLDYH